MATMGPSTAGAGRRWNDAVSAGGLGLIPHVGRYRLFQRALAGPLWTCRVCRESFRRENLERHYGTECRRFDPIEHSFGAFLLEERLAYLLRVRRSRRNLRRARWEYAVRQNDAKAR